MSSDLTQRDRLKNFIKSYAELDSQDSLHELYLECTDEDLEDSQIVKFWKEMLSSYQSKVTKSFKINLGQAMNDLTVHDRVPVAIPTVVVRFMKDKLVLSCNLDEFYS